MTLDEQHEALGGSVPWREIVRLRIGEWLSRQLVEVPAPRARLRQWVAAGLPASAPHGPFELNIVAVGSGCREALRRVACAIPPPVAWHASRNVVVVDAHRPCCARLPAMETPGSDEVVQLVVVRPGDDQDELAATIAHEIAHAWLASAVVDEPRRLGSAGEELLNEWRRTLPLEDPRVQTWARGEELAHILAAQWGFVGKNADIASLRRKGSANYIMEAVKS